jgi:CheY-like chemotaxis protein
MKVLVVEDDENKSAQILTFVRDGLGIEELVTARSYRGCLAKLEQESFDLVLLDITMPTYEVDLDEEGGRHRVYAGRDVLRQMDRRALLIPVIVVTQFEKFGVEMKTRAALDKELANAHPKNYRGMVYYDAAQEGWKEELAAKIKDVVKEKTSK